MLAQAAQTHVAESAIELEIFEIFDSAKETISDNVIAERTGVGIDLISECGDWKMYFSVVDGLSKSLDESSSLLWDGRRSCTRLVPCEPLYLDVRSEGLSGSSPTQVIPRPD